LDAIDMRGATILNSPLDRELADHDDHQAQHPADGIAWSSRRRTVGPLARRHASGWDGALRLPLCLYRSRCIVLRS
jgi:hypothetical protein